MATNNAVNVGLSGSTGTGNFVGSNSPSLVTPNLGVSTATSMVFSPSTNGILGSTAGDAASSGYVGQLINSTFVTGVSLTSAVTANIHVLSIPAGDWDIWSTFITAPAAGTVQTGITYQLNLTTATLSTPSNVATSNIISLQATLTATLPYYGHTGIYPLSVSGSTNIFLNANVAFSVSTLTAGGIIVARRRR